MKKSLSLLLAIALVFSMFSSLAFAAEQSSGEYLKEIGVIKGNSSGDLMEDKTWKRQDVVVILSRLLGQEEEAQNTAKNHSFTDVTDPYYDAYITWAGDNGYFEGKSATRFGYNDEIELYDFLAVMLRALGYDTKGANYANVDDLALELGWIDEDTDLDVTPTRGVLYDYVVVTLNSETVDGEILGAKLGLPGFEEEETATKITKVEQIGAKKIAVTFDGVLEVVPNVELKNGYVPYTVKTSLSEDKTVLTLETDFSLPAGTYTVAVAGFETKEVAVVAEKATALTINGSTIQLINNAKVDYAVTNQFGEKMAVPASNLVINVFDVTQGKQLLASAINPGTDLLLNLAAAGNLGGSDQVKKDDQLLVSLTYSSAALVASKTLTVISASSATSVQLGTVAPLPNATRITVGDSGLVLPYTLTDQYGNSLTLGQHNADSDGNNDVELISGVQFASSNPAIVDVDTFTVDANGVLKFNAGNTDGTVIITAIVPATGANSTTTIVVNKTQQVQSFTINPPAALVVEDETVEIPYQAVDIFGNVIAKGDFKNTANLQQKVSFSSSNNSIVNPATDIRFNAKTNALEITPQSSGVVMIYANVGGILQNYITLDVKPAAVPTKIVGLKNVPLLFQNGASITLTQENLNIIDQYNRPDNLSVVGATYYYAVISYDGGNGSNVSVTNVKITPSSNNTTISGVAAGSENFKVELYSETDGDYTNGTLIATATYKFTAKTIADADIKGYSIRQVPTLYGQGTHNTSSPYAYTLSIVGLDANNNEVTIDTNKITAITSSNLDVIGVGKVGSNFKVFGLKAGTSTVTLWKGATQLASVEVTASEAAPVATTASFSVASIDLTRNTSTGNNAGGRLTVKDQYGVTMGVPTGSVWSSSNTSVATVDANGNISAVASGTATISFVTPNGVAATIEVYVP